MCKALWLVTLMICLAGECNRVYDDQEMVNTGNEVDRATKDATDIGNTQGPIVVIRDQVFRVEIADTPESQERGLMGRRTIDRDSGMLFVFDTPTVAGFWMVNTPVALDVAFIRADGTIASIQHMDALSSELHYATEPVSYALEVAADEFTRRGIKPGDIVTLLPDIATAD